MSLIKMPRGNPADDNAGANTKKVIRDVDMDIFQNRNWMSTTLAF
jgi:hypothetical protein